MECIPFACPSCGARMYFVQETKATTYDMWLFSDDGSSPYKKLPLSEALLTDMLPILILFAGFNVLDVIAHVIRGKLNDAPTSIPLRSTHLCILMFMIVDAAVILILMCRNIVNVAIQIAQLL